MKRSKRILIGAAVAAICAAQAVGLFFLMRTAPASTLTLSETAVYLKLDEGHSITHTIEPAAASGKLIRYKVTAPDGIVAWVDEQNEMIVALAPGACQVKAVLDGQEAVIDVTVSGETVLAGEWSGSGVSLSIGKDLSGTLIIPEGTAAVQWFRGAFSDGENGNPYRYVKLTAECNGMPAVLYYDRLNDTMRLERDGTVRMLNRG